MAYDTAPSSSSSSIFGYMAARQTALEEHPFFQYLATNPPHDWLIKMIPGMSFWVMIFQDVLRLVEDQVSDPSMLAIAKHIKAGDDGHDRWFVRDMQRLGLPQPDLEMLFGPAHEAARKASYAILSEVFRVGDDRLRIVILLALESASYVFFDTMTNYLENTSFPHKLHYFGRTHLDAELKHGIVEAEADILVETAIRASIGLHGQAIELIARVFDAFDQMFEALLGPTTTTTVEAVSVPPSSKAA
jgi:hypothetical protein